MPFTQATIHKMLDAFRGTPLVVSTVHLSLHDDDPGDTGAHEIAGGSYSRKVPSMAAASNKQIANNAAIDFTGMPATTVTHIGVWDGSTFLGGGALTSPRAYGPGDTATIAIGQFVAQLSSGALSTYAANKLLDAIFRGISFGVSTTYAALHTGSPGDNGASEVVGGSYARQAIAFNAPGGGKMANSADEEFLGMPAVTCSHASLWDAPSGGNFLAGALLASSRIFQAGDVARIAAGAIEVG
jgi:hypothetical protein